MFELIHFYMYKIIKIRRNNMSAAEKIRIILIKEI